MLKTEEGYVSDKEKRKYRLLKALRAGLAATKELRAIKIAKEAEISTEAKRGIIEALSRDISQIEAAYRENGGVL